MGAQRDAMQEVELADDGPESATADGFDQPPGAEGDEVLRRRRTRLRRWWPVAVVAVAGVVTTQLVLDARERQRVDAARGLEGVVGYDVGPDLVATPVGHGWDHWRLVNGIAAGDLRVGGDESVEGEPRGVSAVDGASGDVVWRTAVEETAVPAGNGLPEAPDCSADDPPVTQIWCVVHDRGPQPAEEAGYVPQGPIVRSRLLTLDAATGTLLAERELAPGSNALVSGGLLLVVEAAQGGAMHARSEHLATGGVGWATDLPALPEDAQESMGSYAPGLTVDAGHVIVQQPLSAVSLRLSDGAVEAEGLGVWLGRGDRLATSGADGYTWLRGTDGTGTAKVLGTMISLTVDDGSVPGLDLFSDSRTGVGIVSAVDPRTGEAVWQYEVEEWLDGSMILLDGVLYGGDATGVWALDARDGTERWRSERDAVAEPSADGTSHWSSWWVSPMTDGRRLLLVQDPGDGPELSAWSLEAGEPLWTAPLPDGAGDQLNVWDHKLYGGEGEDLVRVGGGER
jgi:outer membrane protein assembly factor BamB